MDYIKCYKKHWWLKPEQNTFNKEFNSKLETPSHNIRSLSSTECGINENQKREAEEPSCIW